MRRSKKIKVFSLRRLLTFLLFFLIVSFASVMSLAADDISVQVVEGDTTINVKLSRMSHSEIMRKIQREGLEPFSEYDVGIFSDNNTVYTIYRAAEVTVRDNDKENTFPVSSYKLSKDVIIDECVKRFAMPICEENDSIIYNKNKKELIIRRAFSVTFNENDTYARTVSYFGETVEEFLDRNKVKISDNDTVSLPFSTVLSAGAVLNVEHKAKITLVSSGETTEHLVPISSVQEVLSRLGITLSDDDIVSHPLDSIIEEEMTLEVNRVTYKEVIEDKEIDYEIIRKETDSLTQGQTTVEQYGEEGVKRINKKQKFIDGELAEEEIISEEVISEPVNKIVLVGTKPSTKPIVTTMEPGTLVDYNGNTVSYTSYHTGKSAAYTGGSYTSIGVPVAAGCVAINPNLIPYGTRLYIASPDGSFVYGYATASDTGGAVMSGNYLVDCYYETLEECYNFGIRKLNVYILS